MAHEIGKGFAVDARYPIWRRYDNFSSSFTQRSAPHDTSLITSADYSSTQYRVNDLHRSRARAARR